MEKYSLAILFLTKQTINISKKYNYIALF